MPTPYELFFWSVVFTALVACSELLSLAGQFLDKRNGRR
jgi:hypothetical protein